MGHDSQLFRISYDVEDYFHRLGGSGRYSGYEDWHVHAFIILLSKDFDPSEEHRHDNQLQGFVFRSRLDKMFYDEQRVKEVKSALENVAGLEREIALFLHDVDEFFERPLFIQNPRGHLSDYQKMNHLRCLKRWSVFSWCFKNTYCIARHSRDF